MYVPCINVTVKYRPFLYDRYFIITVQCIQKQLVIPDTNGNVHCMLLARQASRCSEDGHVHLLKKIVLFFICCLTNCSFGQALYIEFTHFSNSG